jgi:hypothetical protein
MRVIKNVGLVILGVLLGIAASTRADAQGDRRFRFQPIQPGLEIQAGQPVGTIIMNENIGFQLIATPTSHDDVATGKLMIKVDGRWLPAAAPTGVVPAR